MLRCISLLAVVLILGGFMTTVVLGQTTMQFATGWSVNNAADWTSSPEGGGAGGDPLGAPDNECVGTSTPTGSWVEFTFPAFGIPATDIVTGIEVRVNYRSSATNTAQLTKNGSLVGDARTVPEAFVGPSFCSSAFWVSAGSASDPWGTSLITADFNAGTVGFRLTQNANTIDLDAVEIIVHHGTNAPPVASITATPTSGESPLDVNFDGSASSDSDGTITSYDWDFGDGATDTGQTTSHGYAANGTYTATLTVTDDDGATDTATETITVSDTPLIANVVAASGKPYVVSTMSVGETYYIDKPHTITALPSALDGATSIRTDSKDKGNKDAVFLTFDLSVEATVYVGFDSGANLPAWLDPPEWTDTGDQIVTTDKKPLDVYSRVYVAGQVELGGAKYPPANGRRATVKAMYIVAAIRTVVARLQEAGEAPPMLSVQDVPETFAIESIYPNPFNPSTTVRVGLVERGMYHVGVYNTLGQQVYQSELDASAPGWYTVRLTLDTFSSGVYFVHVRHRTTGAVVTGKMLLVK